MSTVCCSRMEREKAVLKQGGEGCRAHGAVPSDVRTRVPLQGGPARSSEEIPVMGAKGAGSFAAVVSPIKLETGAREPDCGSAGNWLESLPDPKAADRKNRMEDPQKSSGKPYR